MGEVPVFLAFADGVLGYRCQGCDQRCCKTGALPLFPAETEKLIYRHPALELVLSQQQPLSLAHLPKSGCWFLGETGACGLHQPSKPSACSLFPTNVFGLLDEALVVGPSGLCPMTVLPTTVAAAGKSGDFTVLDHAQTLASLGRLGAAGLPPAPLRPYHGSFENILVLETAIRDASGAMLGHANARDGWLPILAYTYLLGDAFFVGGAKALTKAKLDHQDAVEEALLTMRQDFLHTLGIAAPSTKDHQEVAPLLLAYHSALRLFGFERIPPARLPEALLALELYAAYLGSQGQGQTINGQSLMELVSTMAPMIELLLRWQRPWPQRANIAIPSQNTFLQLQPGRSPAEQVALPADLLPRSEMLRAVADALQAFPPEDSAQTTAANASNTAAQTPTQPQSSQD